MTDQKPTTQGERLGAELRRLRQRAGLSGRQMAQRVGLSQSKASRIERGESVPSVPQVTTWARESGLEDTTHVVALAEAALTEVDPWRSALHHQGQAGLQQIAQELEHQAGTIRSFQPALIPGLLQIPEYARRVLIAADTVGGQDHSAAVARRVDRQQVLYEQVHTFEFILTEGALRFRPGPRAMAATQLDHIASIAALSNVTVGIIPLDIEAPTVPLHGFTLYDDLPDDRDPFVVVETLHAQLTISDTTDIVVYRDALTRLRNTALHHDQAEKTLTRLAEEMRTSRARP